VTSAATRRWLLSWARHSIEASLRGESDPTPADPPAEVQQPAGCFVTLHGRGGALRGCIGTFAAEAPLWCAVRDMAIAAASRDPRFAAVTAEELTACDIEISVLSPPVPANATAVEVGHHGIVMRRGSRHGVLLPQVAVAQGWDRETFLDRTCRKAGLPPGAWRDGSVEIELFSAEVFGEAQEGT